MDAEKDCGVELVDLRALYGRVFAVAAMPSTRWHSPDELQIPLPPPQPRLVAVSGWVFDGALSRPISVAVLRRQPAGGRP